LLFVSAGAQTPLLDQVRSANTRGDFATADRALEGYRQRFGANAEYALAMSWQARAGLAQRNLELAETYADKARDISLQLLKSRKLDAETMLPLALGASIEVHGQVMAQRGETSSAVGFLESEKRKYAGTSIVERIAKNINLLSLKGKRAPSLDAAEWIGAKPGAWSTYRGKPVLVFFWAHWCPDCKRQGPILARLQREFAAKGLVVVGPTQRYGYGANGDEAKPAAEMKYIGEVQKQFYGDLTMTVPLSEDNFKNWGCSTTPTLALIDRQGIVRLYHPGDMSYDDLRPLIAKIAS
jgi:thiol-disulfide isomerase/thioredoxin